MNDLFATKCPCCGREMPETAEAAVTRILDDKLTFSEFWSIWPSKIGKVAAQTAWRKLSKDMMRSAIDTAPRWCQWWRKENPDASHIHASTYLNQRRWEDDAAIGAACSDDDKMKYYADLVNGEKRLFNSISGSLARDLVSSGLVSQKRMDERIGS